MHLGITKSNLHAETDEEPTAGDHARPKVLVIATVHWAATTRLCLAMADGGFDVRAIAPDDHAVRLPATAWAVRVRKRWKPSSKPSRLSGRTWWSLATKRPSVICECSMSGPCVAPSATHGEWPN